jgi:hypothetical protein
MKFCWLILISVFAFAAAPAAEVASLYTAQVPFDQNERNARNAAYADALRQVLLRVSGSELVSDRDMYEALFPNPEAYVVQFGPGPDETLFVSFDGAAIEQTLRSAGQTVWGGDRPLTLVWLAVDRGQGQREIIGSEDAETSSGDARSVESNRQLREHILDIAQQRGLPVVFPLLDSQDLASVDFSDIWGGFNEQLVAASERYEVNSILIGRVRPNAAEQNRWTYVFGDDQRNWSGEPEYVITQVSDLLANQFAVGGDEPLRSVSLSIAGIDSVDAYGKVQSILAKVNVVDSLSITEVAGDRVYYRVTAHGGAARLARALRFAGLVEQERIDMGGTGVADDLALDSLEFYYNP